MKVCSLFSGIGGFDLAFVRQGHEIIYANEWDKYASSIYKVRIGEIDTRDITTVSECEIPEHDILCGGFPCQAFSVAGRRLGFDDTRGTLFFEIARILREKKPRLCLLENVKGLLSHDNGNTFKTIISTLTELGYDLQWQVLNSKNFGVPQNRERVFIVGHLRGTPRPEVFPIQTSDSGAIQNSTKDTGQETAWVLRQRDYKDGTNFIIHNKYGGFGETSVRRFYDYSPTIRTPKGGGHIPDVVQGKQVRKLTPTECERLQGFPDGWTEKGTRLSLRMASIFPISDTQRYKCLGNAVTVNVVEEIVKRL